MDRTRLILCLLVGVFVAGTAVSGVSAVSRNSHLRVKRAAAVVSDPVSLLSINEAETETEPISSASTADYSDVAAAQERPEPVPPPRPPQFNRPKSEPVAAAAPPAATAPAPTAPATSLVSTAAAATTTAATSDSSKGASASASGITTHEAIKNYNEFLARNFKFAQSLSTLFKTCDLNGDGKIDIRSELPRLVSAGTISQEHANVIASWDTDRDGFIRENEWNMGLLYVNLLQYNTSKKQEFETATASGADTTRFTEMFARMSKGDASDLPRLKEMKMALRNAEGKTEEELALDAEAEQQQMLEAAALKADDTARFAARHGRRRKHEHMTNKAARAMELLAQKRPTSKHGIPSEADEHCVMCQFLVQRIQKQLYYTLANGNDGFSADPNAEVSAKKMKQVNSQLLNRRGGKGLLRILSEDIVSDMCEADQMPELYYSACKRIDEAFPTILDAVYFQFHSEAVCEEAKMCGSQTYFNQDTSVHLPSKSIIFNSGRGRCGLMGGARERADAFFSAAICFANTIFESEEQPHENNEIDEPTTHAE